MKKLRIATMITGHFRIPPPVGTVYAPMDIAKAVAEGLAAKGHEVTFFAPTGSVIEGATMEGLDLPPLTEAEPLPIMRLPNVRGKEQEKIANLWDQYLIARIYKMASEGTFDLIYIHPVDRALPFAYAFQQVPVVYALHDPIYEWRAEVYRLFRSPNQWYVTASKAQQDPATDLPYAGVVPHGLDVEQIPVGAGKGDYLLYLGRITRDKNVHEAVQAAAKTQETLLIAGPEPAGDDKNVYWKKEIEPYLSDRIRYVGPVWGDERFKLMGEAKALLFPAHNNEAFGLVMPEALACGTPVIGMNRASVPEVVEDGKAGFVVNDIQEMTEAIAKIPQISRTDCRTAAEERFSKQAMVDAYERIFQEVVQRHQEERLK